MIRVCRALTDLPLGQNGRNGTGVEPFRDALRRGAFSRQLVGKTCVSLFMRGPHSVHSPIVAGQHCVALGPAHAWRRTGARIRQGEPVLVAPLACGSCRPRRRTYLDAGRWGTRRGSPRAIGSRNSTTRPRATRWRRNSWTPWVRGRRGAVARRPVRRLRHGGRRGGGRRGGGARAAYRGAGEQADDDRHAEHGDDGGRDAHRLAVLEDAGGALAGLHCVFVASTPGGDQLRRPRDDPVSAVASLGVHSLPSRVSRRRTARRGPRPGSFSSPTLDLTTRRSPAASA